VGSRPTANHPSAPLTMGGVDLYAFGVPASRRACATELNVGNNLNEPSFTTPWASRLAAPL